MECVVPKGDHLRTLAGAIQRIGQIGKEIFFEGTATAVRGAVTRAAAPPTSSRLTPDHVGTDASRSQQLTLRTLNESKSAFAAFSFHSGEAAAALHMLRLL